MTARSLTTGRASTLASALAVGALAFALVGCTPQESPEPTPTPTATADAEQTPGITDIQDPPGSGENLVGALADTSTTACERGDGGWNVAGTVTNPTDAPASYRIYVSLLTEEQDTRALQQVNVDAVDAGASTEWSTTIPLEEDGLSCVLRVERYAA